EVRRRRVDVLTEHQTDRLVGRDVRHGAAADRATQAAAQQTEGAAARFRSTGRTLALETGGVASAATAGTGKCQGGQGEDSEVSDRHCESAKKGLEVGRARRERGSEPPIHDDVMHLDRLLERAVEEDLEAVTGRAVVG